MTSLGNQTEQCDKVFTPANVVTLIRICLVPVFVIVLVSPWPEYFGAELVTESFKRYIAAGIFVLISATDWLDGYLARSRGEVTDFGKFMDPLADKILVVAALMALIELDALPSWVALIIVAREFIVSGVRMVAASKGEVIAASWYGKFKTVFQMIAIVLFTVKDGYMSGPFNAAISDALWVVSWAVMIVALVLTIISMLDYIAKARHLIGLGNVSFSKNLHAEQMSHEGLSRGSNEDSFANFDRDADTLLSGEELYLLSSEVLAAAKQSHKKLGTAESLTGGLICSYLTAVPGSSTNVLGGIVSYDPAVKVSKLKVSQDIVDRNEVVSEECARAMAHGARNQLSADITVAVTGIAGPGGEETGKPVGTVCFACASSFSCESYTMHFSGSREDVRLKTVAFALRLLLQKCTESA